MKFHSAELTVSSSKSMEIVDVTEQVDSVLAESRIRNGVLNLWVPHTTAAIMVNEHEPNLWEDILTILGQLALLVLTICMMQSMCAAQRNRTLVHTS